MAIEDIVPLIEALVFVSTDPLSLRDLQEILDEFPPDEVKAAIEALCSEFEQANRGLMVVPAAGGYQLLTKPGADAWVRKLLRARNQDRLTVAALETLAIIAYKQPITLPEILALRRVNSTGVIKTLLDKNLIRILGRKKVVGSPILYGTSKEFLQRFGLNSLKDLPSLDEFRSLVEQSGIELMEDEPAGIAGEGTSAGVAGEGAAAPEPQAASDEGDSDHDLPPEPQAASDEGDSDHDLPPEPQAASDEGDSDHDLPPEPQAASDIGDFGDDLPPEPGPSRDGDPVAEADFETVSEEVEVGPEAK